MHLDVYRLDKSHSVELYPHSHITGQLFVIEQGLVRTTTSHSPLFGPSPADALPAEAPPVTGGPQSALPPRQQGSWSQEDWPPQESWPQESWSLMPGQIGWMPPHVVHAAKVHGPVRGWGVHLPADLCQFLPASACIMGQTALASALLHRVAGWQPGPVTDPARQRLLLVLLDELQQAPTLPNGLPLPQDSRLQRFAKALLNDPDDKTPLGQWAEQLALSERTLARRFAQETGLTCGQWRQRARLFRSLDLLADGQPITAVALAVGYDSLSAFGAAFRRHFGCSPQQYRNGTGARSQRSDAEPA